MSHYQVIVVGLGGVGSAALYQLARRGVKALGLDRFPVAHDRGSSHGATRIIRQAYLEHPDYVPLVLRAYELWAELEQRRGEQLFFETGLLQVGPLQGAVLRGVRTSATTHGLNVTDFTAGEIEARWPGLKIPSGVAGLFEQKAGYLRVEACVRAHVEGAVTLGAEVRLDEPAIAWAADGDGVRVQSERKTYFADQLIIAAGAWSAEVLRELNIPLVVRRKPQYWFAPRDEAYRREGGFPAYLFEMPSGIFYGFPQIDAEGVKVARHSGGDVVADPLALNRELDASDLASVREFCAACLPRLLPDLLRHSVCMYTLTPDEHFIIDAHPLHPRVAFAAGLSGHGFKFTPVLGEALADLAMEGATRLPVGFLSLKRPSLCKR